MSKRPDENPELIAQLQANYPGILVVSADENRLTTSVTNSIWALNDAQIAAAKNKADQQLRALYTWSVGLGLVRHDFSTPPKNIAPESRPIVDPGPAVAWMHKVLKDKHQLASASARLKGIAFEVPEEVKARGTNDVQAWLKPHRTQLEAEIKTFHENLIKMGVENPHDSFVMVLRHFHHYLKNPSLQMLLINSIMLAKTVGVSIVMDGPVADMPVELEKLFSFINIDYPNAEDLGDLFDFLIASMSSEKRDEHSGRLNEQKKLLIDSALGLTILEAENSFARVIQEASRGGAVRTDIVLKNKVSALKKTGLLEYIDTRGLTLDDLGGMAQFKEWLAMRSMAFGEEARNFGLPAPKGTLLVGPPGTGKSLGAKVVATALGVPLIKFDVGRMFGGLVGQSEGNLRSALTQAEAMAPCVLWVN